MKGIYDQNAINHTLDSIELFANKLIRQKSQMTILELGLAEQFLKTISIYKKNKEESE